MKASLLRVGSLLFAIAAIGCDLDPVFFDGKLQARLSHEDAGAWDGGADAGAESAPAVSSRSPGQR